MPTPQTQTKTESNVGTKIAGAVLIIAGLGMLGLAAGAMPSIGQAEKVPELSGLIKNDGASVTYAGDALPYVILVKNSGTAPAKDVKIANRIASGTLTYKTAVGTNGFTCSLVSANVTCTGGIIPPGKTASIKVETTLAVNTLPCNSTGTISGTLSIDPDNTILESDELNNTASTTNSMLGACSEQNADLTITKAGSPSSVKDNEILSYSITVKNDGTVTATSVVVQDKLSSDLWTLKTATASNGFTCTSSGNTVTCSGGTIAGGDTATITLVGGIGLSGLACGETSTLTDTAKVDPENQIAETSESNNSATVNSTITGPCGGSTTTTTSGGSSTVTTGSGGSVSAGSGVSGSSGASPINR